MNQKDKAVLEVIKKHIKDLGVTNRKKLDEFSVSCLDEYHMGIENGDSEVEALKKALDSLDEVLTPNLTKIVPLPHKFPYMSASSFSRLVSSSRWSGN